MDQQRRAGNSSSRVTRWLFGAAGVVCVGLGALGAVLPVLPTTIFLIGAVACFARSWPWLERKLLGHRLFKPYMQFVYGKTPLTRRARLTAIATMWCCVLISAGVMMWRDEPATIVAGTLIGLGVIATVTIALWRRERPAGAKAEG